MSTNSQLLTAQKAQLMAVGITAQQAEVLMLLFASAYGPFFASLSTTPGITGSGTPWNDGGVVAIS